MYQDSSSAAPLAGSARRGRCSDRTRMNTDPTARSTAPLSAPLLRPAEDTTMTDESSLYIHVFKYIILIMYLITHSYFILLTRREDDTSVILTITFSTSCLTFDSAQHNRHVY